MVLQTMPEAVASNSQPSQAARAFRPPCSRRRRIWQHSRAISESRLPFQATRRELLHRRIMMLQEILAPRHLQPLLWSTTTRQTSRASVLRLAARARSLRDRRPPRPEVERPRRRSTPAGSTPTGTGSAGSGVSTASVTETSSKGNEACRGQGQETGAQGCRQSDAQGGQTTAQSQAAGGALAVAAISKTIARRI